jgi:hypothetical protein
MPQQCDSRLFASTWDEDAPLCTPTFVYNDELMTRRLAVTCPVSASLLMYVSELEWFWTLQTMEASSVAAHPVEDAEHTVETWFASHHESLPAEVKKRLLWERYFEVGPLTFYWQTKSMNGP